MTPVDVDTVVFIFLFAGALVGMALWASRSRRHAALASAGLVLYVVALLTRMYW